MEQNRSRYRIAKMAQWLQVSKSGYYAWRKRPKSPRCTENESENILNRDFTADRPGQKMVSDITYIPTEEGWLYLAGVMDLCGNKIVGVSMDGRMTKELVISALKDAIRRTPFTEGCILHSDRGSQYCSWIIRHLQKSMDLSAA